MKPLLGRKPSPTLLICFCMSGSSPGTLRFSQDQNNPGTQACTLPSVISFTKFLLSSLLGAPGLVGLSTPEPLHPQQYPVLDSSKILMPAAPVYPSHTVLGDKTVFFRAPDIGLKAPLVHFREWKRVSLGMKLSLPVALLNKSPLGVRPEEAGAKSGRSAPTVSLSHLREAKQPARGWPSMCLQSPAAVRISTQPAWRVLT